MSAIAVPEFLGAIWPSVGIEPLSPARLAEEVRDADRVTGPLAQACASSVAYSFEEACLVLLGCELADAASGSDHWLEVRHRVGVQLDGLEFVSAERSVLLHAALVGLARGAAEEAFEYAESRQVAGSALIELDLLAARLFSLAATETIAELQLGRLCEGLGRAEEHSGQVSACVEIRRAAMIVMSENAQVWGGHGVVQLQSSARRVELAHALIRALSTVGGAK